MKELQFTTNVKVYKYEELAPADRELVDAAKAACRNAFVPYSKFHVGAAIRMEDGSIVAGSNQENAAYPSGLCAERTTAFYASASHPNMPMKAIVIAAWSPAQFPEGTPDDECYQRKPVSPCGACRQALLEYEHRDGPMRVILFGADEIYEFPSVASTLPYCFTDF